MNISGGVEIWKYSVGHACLLLRRNPFDNVADRIELLFINVRHISLPTCFCDVEIRTDRAGGELLESLSTASSDCFKYEIWKQEAQVGAVIAGNFVHHTDQQPYWAPSYFQSHFEGS
jgi:hypothetical protein